MCHLLPVQCRFENAYKACGISHGRGALRHGSPSLVARHATGVPVPLLTVHALARALQETLKACPGRRDRGGTPLQQRSCRLLSIRTELSGPIGKGGNRHVQSVTCFSGLQRQLCCSFPADVPGAFGGRLQGHEDAVGMYRKLCKARCYCAKTGSSVSTLRGASASLRAASSSCTCWRTRL